MQAQILGGNGIYPVRTGQRELLVLFGTGPSSYNQTTGDPVTVASPGVYLDAVNQAMTVSKTYEVRFYPSATNTTRASWVAKWYVISTGAEVTNAVDLSAEKIQFSAMGGEF